MTTEYTLLGFILCGLLSGCGYDVDSTEISLAEKACTGRGGLAAIIGHSGERRKKVLCEDGNYRTLYGDLIIE